MAPKPNGCIEDGNGCYVTEGQMSCCDPTSVCSQPDPSQIGTCVPGLSSDALVGDNGWRFPTEMFYMVGALLMVVLITINVTCMVMRAKWRCCTKGRKYDAVKVYDSEDHDVRVPISR